MPALELDNGTVLSQGAAIMEYIGATYNLKGDSSLTAYRGHSIAEFLNGDYVFKILSPAMFAPEDQKGAKMQEVFAKLPEVLAKLEKVLPETKFLSGDSVSIYDILVAGFFTNIVLNESSPLFAAFAPFYANAGPRL